MLLTDRRTPPSDPLLPRAALLPLSDTGGVQHTTANKPGLLRPFVATLGVPRPLVVGKHNTTSTTLRSTTNSQTSRDGQVVGDTVSDTSTDT